MAKYIQRISLLGKERWIGWEIDGIGTEIPGLTLAEELPAEELARRGVKHFAPMSFESFVGMGATIAVKLDHLDDQDVAFRLDALQVGMDRFRAKGFVDLPKAVLLDIFGESDLEDPRIQTRFREWQESGAVEVIGQDDCYLRITGRMQP
jgi:hypothetical protein